MITKEGGRANRRGRRGRTWWLWAAAIVASACAIAGWWRVRQPVVEREAVLVPPAGAAPGVPAPPLLPADLDSLARAGPEALYRRAVSLVQHREFSRSLPYYLRALEEPGAPWHAHCNYGTALHNAALQARVHLGRTEGATGSSFERVAMMREALREFDVAERLAGTSKDRAFAIASRAHRLLTWGMPWDALQEFRRAEALDPGWGRSVRHLILRLHDPARPEP